MNQSNKQGRLLLTLLASSGLLTGGGLGVWRFASPGTPIETTQEATEKVAAPAAPGSLDAVAQSWAAEQDSASRASEGDPFLHVATPATVSQSENAVKQAAYSEPAPSVVGDRYAVAPTAYEESTLEITRGQSPVQLDATPQASSGNPLRAATTVGRYDTAGADEARRAFGEVLAADAAHKLEDEEPNTLREPSALPVAALDSQEVPAAFEEEAEAGEDSLAPIPFEPGPIAAAPLDETPPGPLATVPAADEASQGLPTTEAATSPPAELPDYNQLRSTTPPSAPPTAFAEPPVEQEAPDRMASVVTERTQLPSSPPENSSYPAYGTPQQEFQSPTPSATANPQPGYDLPSASSPSMTSSAPGAGRPGERAMEGRQQPTLAIQKFAPAEIQVGKPCKFVTKVRNMGQRPAMGVVLRDQTPAGTRLMATTPQAESSGGDIRWDLGTLAPGEERTLEMELTPTEEGEIGSVATVTFATQATARARCTRPQLAVRMTAPEQVLVGRQQRVQIELKNPGTGDATGVMLTENVPENLRHEAGAALEFEVGTLRAGETRTMELVLNAEKAGKVVNTLTARADGNLEVQQSVEFEVVAPELSVGVSGPKRRYLERPATYTVSINNPGTASARDVRLVTKLPQGMRFVKATNLGEYDASTHSVYWSLAELPNGEHGEVQLTAMPVTSGELTLQVQGQASEGLQDESEMAIQIEGIAALQFTVLDVEDPIEVGGETVYEVRVENEGTKGATNVGVRFVTPPGMRAIAASGDTSHRVQNGAVVFAPIERLAPKGSANFRIRVEGVQPGDHRLTVEVTSDDLAHPVRKEESTRVFGDE